MKINELPDWPPLWVCAWGNKFAIGEIGILKKCRPFISRLDYIEMHIEDNDIEHSGLLQIDPALRDKVITILTEHKGQAVKDIGQLDID
jgi:hypothetical protein